MGVIEREEEGMKGLCLICVFKIKTFITLTLEVYTFFIYCDIFLLINGP